MRTCSHRPVAALRYPDVFVRSRSNLNRSAIRFVLLQVIALFSIQPNTSGAQGITRIEGNPCEPCSLTHERIGTLSGTNILSQPNEVRRLPDGNYAIVFGIDRAVLFVFEASGRLVRQIGRRGGGPGEYEFIVQVIPDSTGSLALWDPIQYRLTFVSNDEASRVIRIPHSFGRVLPFGHGFVGSSIAGPTPDVAGYPLHLMNEDGQLTRSFGSEDGTYRSDRSIEYARSIAIADDDILWSAPPTRYLLEAWNPNGDRVHAIERVVRWFPPGTHVGARQDDPTARPASYLREIEVDELGRIWTLTLVADDDWKEAIETRTTIQGLRVTAAARDKRDQYWDTVVEVIDPDSNGLIASHRFDQYFPNFADAGFVYSYREDDGGRPYIELYRIDASVHSQRR
jgi:hypothetical protein